MAIIRYSTTEPQFRHEGKGEYLSDWFVEDFKRDMSIELEGDVVIDFGAASVRELGNKVLFMDDNGDILFEMDLSEAEISLDIDLDSDEENDELSPEEENYRAEDYYEDDLYNDTFMGHSYNRFDDLMESYDVAHPTSQRFLELLFDLAELHAQKQEDYGREDDPLANVRAAKEWGLGPSIAAMVRMGDKFRRLQAFATKGELANESVEDSLRDIAVYAIITLILLEQGD